MSQWGHDFRPDYKALGAVRQQFPGVPLMALTATATHNVILDVKHNLGMAGCEVFSQSFNRPNLCYEVISKEKQYIASIISLIKGSYSGQTGIVYVLSRKSTEKIAAELIDAGIAAHHYHAAMEARDKSRVQQRWQSGRIKVVVATIAFGMGIDKPDVRFVIHASIPKSLEGYYQETGRAGRDGKPSNCYLYFTYGDLSILRKMIKEGEGNKAQKDRQFEMLNRMVEFAEEQEECRRVNILRYFGEQFDKEDCQKTCDNCRAGATFHTKDYSQYAIAAIETLQKEGELTVAQCADILLGRGSRNVPKGLWYGCAKGLKRPEVTRLLHKLLALGALTDVHRVMNKNVGFPIMYLAPARGATQYLSGKVKLMMVSEVGAKSARPAATTASTSGERA
ncbi:MAG: RecQ family ATP-dependent DNA helicase, partial [Cytophagales bacterium]|nr:RecQ family ATP-dependent DNA helicase [Cytophagales bacterium]